MLGLGKRERFPNVPIMGDPSLERWVDKPENRQMNNGMGTCNTGARRRGTCCLGGIGCNVDHAWIGFHAQRAADYFDEVGHS